MKLNVKISLILEIDYFPLHRVSFDCILQSFFWYWLQIENENFHFREMKVNIEKTRNKMKVKVKN